MRETISQIYATHCTYGNSAIERREGELADRVLGYRARAGSFSQFDLRKYFRTIERYLYYQLPKDVSAETKLEFTEAAAPARMVFCPEMNGLQILAHICYRQRDVANRVGSYFAHVLLQPVDTKVRRWSATDCLRLWGCPAWVREDAPSLPFELAKFGDLSEFPGGYSSPVSDVITHRFFTEASYSPPGLLGNPQTLNRWCNMDPAARQRLLKNAVQGFLEVARKTQRSLLLVIEPEVAVLFFFAIARLFPNKMTRDFLSLSTYEPFPDRLPTALAATHFCDNQRHDLSADVYRTGSVVNSFSERCSEWDQRTTSFANELVDRLCQDGWDSIDQQNRQYEAVGAERVEQFIELHRARQVVQVILSPPQELPAECTKVSSLSRSFMARHILQHFCDDADSQQGINALSASPAHLFTTLQITTGEAESSDFMRIRQRLLNAVSEGDFAELLQLQIPEADKLTALRLFIEEEGRLPVGLESFWSGRGAVRTSARASDSTTLPVNLLRQIKPADIERLWRSTEKKDRLAFALALIRAIDPTDFRRDNVLQKAVSMLDPPQAYCLVEHLGTKVEQLSRVTREHLAIHLGEVITQFPCRPVEALKKLNTLKAARHILRPAAASQLDGWVQLSRELSEAETRRKRPRGLSRRPQRLTPDQRDANGELLAPHICSAFRLSRSTRAREREGGDQDELLGIIASIRTVSDALGCDPSILPNEMDRKLANFIESDYFADVILKRRFGRPAPTKRRGRKYRTKRFMQVATIIAAALAVVVIVAIYGLEILHGIHEAKDSPNRVAERDSTDRPKAKPLGPRLGDSAPLPPLQEQDVNTEMEKGLTGKSTASNGQTTSQASGAKSDDESSQSDEPEEQESGSGTGALKKQGTAIEPSAKNPQLAPLTSQPNQKTRPSTPSESPKAEHSSSDTLGTTDERRSATAPIHAKTPSMRSDGDYLEVTKINDGEVVLNIFSVKRAQWKLTRVKSNNKWEIAGQDGNKVATVVIAAPSRASGSRPRLRIRRDTDNDDLWNQLRNSVIKVGDEKSNGDNFTFIALRTPRWPNTLRLSEEQEVKSTLGIPDGAQLVREDGTPANLRRHQGEDYLRTSLLEDLWFPIDVDTASGERRVLVQRTTTEEQTRWQ